MRRKNTTRTHEPQPTDGLIRFPPAVSARLRALEQGKMEAIQQTAIRFGQVQLEYIRGYCDASGIDIEETQLDLLPDMSGARRRARSVEIGAKETHE